VGLTAGIRFRRRSPEITDLPNKDRIAGAGARNGLDDSSRHGSKDNIPSGTYSFHCEHPTGFFLPRERISFSRDRSVISKHLSLFKFDFGMSCSDTG